MPIGYSGGETTQPHPTTRAVTKDTNNISNEKEQVQNEFSQIVNVLIKKSGLAFRNNHLNIGTRSYLNDQRKNIYYKIATNEYVLCRVNNKITGTTIRKTLR